MDRGKNLFHAALGAVAAVVVITASAVVTTASVAPAAGGAFTVDDPADAVDAAIDGVCATATSTCTLRAAVQEADAAGGVTDIGFAPAADTSSLTVAGSGGADVGDLDVGPGVTLRLIGNVIAPGTTTLVKSAMSDRHFHVHAGGRLELVHVSLAGGSTSGDGGAVLNEGDVLISNTATAEAGFTALSGNTAAGVGGAIANGAGATLTVSNVSTAAAGSRVDLSGNSAKHGGAIANEGGTVVLAGSSPPGLPSHDVYVDNNAASADGGAVWNSSGSLTIGCRAFLRFSSADTGGDLHNAGTTTFDGGGVDAGTATTAGGGVFNDTTGTIAFVADHGCSPGQVTRSTTTGNGGGLYNKGIVTVAEKAQLSISGDGAGPDAVEGAGVYQEQGELAVAGLLVIDTANAQSNGGGLRLASGDVTTDPTGRIRLVKDHAGGDGGGAMVSGGNLIAQLLADSDDAVGSGGAIAVTGGQVRLHRSAIVNSSSSQGGGVAVSGGSVQLENTTLAQNVSASNGGALALVSGDAQLRHVTVASNSTGVHGVPAARPALQRVLMVRNNGQDCTGPVVAGDFNAFDESTCNPQGTDLTDTSRFSDVADRMDGNLADGDPYTYDLHDGNPAIDLVTDVGCGTPDVDQVGSARPADGDGDGTAACDAGAIEAPDAAPARTITGTVTSEVTREPMEGVCVFAGRVDGPDGADNDHMAVTDADGRYLHQVPSGQYLVAFFVPQVATHSAKGCGGDDNAIDLSTQPEWYRNVAVEFSDPSDPHSDPVFPSLSEISPVQVLSVDVADVDACLGPGPGAGQDAPCTNALSESGEDDAPPATAPPVSDGSTGSSAAGTTASSGGPTKLAFTGTNGSAAWMGLFMVVAGAAMALVARRPRRPPVRS